MKTFLFPGQGSQHRGMGGTLFDEFPQLTQAASDILGYSIKELCLWDLRNELNRTQFTQPAIYVVSALSYFKKTREDGEAAQMFAGHSLGEFNALLAAGCFDFELGVELVKKRGELLGKVSGGAMAAIMGASRDEIQAILREQAEDGIDIAIHNSPLQSVISGPKADLTRVEPHFGSKGVAYYPLNTSGAFHSRCMRPASEEFRAFLANVKFAPLRKPVIANISGRPYRDEDLVSNLVNQLIRPVLWLESIQYLLRIEGMEFEEIGPGDTLTKLLRKIEGQTSISPGNAADSAVQGSSRARADPERSALERVTAWNAAHPIGTKVRTVLLHGNELGTSSAAVILFGRRAAIYLQGYDGYFDLDQIEPVRRHR